ncbi:MAG: Fic family protein [Eggerthellales bacterium]|nr:Fic family protein [Eggerthellales bacterium]
MWPKITYETCPWERDPDELWQIPKSKRRMITASYEAAIPAIIADETPRLDPELMAWASELRILMARFDQEQLARGYNLPALILRSESSSSSQIERLTSSVRNVALAELSDKTSGNARLIAANVSAMRKALAHSAPDNISLIQDIHDTLLGESAEQRGFRNEQVWIGGTAYSPHGALFVPPQASRVPSCLEDLLTFSKRQDVDPLVKAAIFHAQFETIHPFTDGNGRTGRALLHRMMAADEVLLHATLPISAGLLHDVDAYMAALNAYHSGQIEPIVRQLLNALELAMTLGVRMAHSIDEVIGKWDSLTTERKGSAARRLASILVEQPVINVPYAAAKLDISERAARNLIETACERGILTKMGNAKRGSFYQASELIEILEEASDIGGIKRMAAGRNRNRTAYDADASRLT